MGWSWVPGTFKGGLDSGKGEEYVGGSRFVRMSTWVCCPPHLSHYRFVVVCPRKPPLPPPPAPRNNQDPLCGTFLHAGVLGGVKGGERVWEG
jgi:hypothetical protein